MSPPSHHLKSPPPKKPTDPVRRCGACIFNYTGTHCLLVKQRNAKWGVPKGSVENQEDDISCMYREVLEETNFDLRHHKHVFIHPVSWKQYKIFLIYLPDNVFWDMYPRDSQEIEKIEWVHISDLRQYTLNYITKYTLYRKKAKDKIPALIKRRRNSEVGFKLNYHVRTIASLTGPSQHSGSNSSISTNLHERQYQFNRYYFKRRRIPDVGRSSPSSPGNRITILQTSTSSTNPASSHGLCPGFSGSVCKRKNHFSGFRQQHTTTSKQHHLHFITRRTPNTRSYPYNSRRPYIIPQKRRGRAGYHHPGTT